ncbi:MAG: hypothetical protein C0402_00610 [Thermodesulfovibrio sp.]|nr:hypothetical protein [Thermodesulfovibrio sp.]
MKQRGFTLIEVIVVMTIVTIMAGILIPFAYKTLEEMKVNETKEKMLTIKRAVLGDLNMTMEGGRTLHAFVLDNGELPAAVAHPRSGIDARFTGATTISDELLSDPGGGTYPNWKGPYVVGSDYKKDAWGDEVVYTVTETDDNDRRIKAELRSYGVDRTKNSADDIVMTIDFDETVQYHRNALTRKKMADLKKAMVGDRSLVQSGIRTHYGFVGECGQLPITLSALVSPSGMLYHDNCKNKKPYLYDSADYDKDAWGTALQYTRLSPEDAEHRVALLKSAGADKVWDTADDITETTDPDLQIFSKEVTPTNALGGSAAVTLTNNSLSLKYAAGYSVNVYATYVSAFNPQATMSTDCRSLAAETINVGEARTVTTPLNVTFPNMLPVGKILLRCRLFSNATCNGSPVTSTTDAPFFVHDTIVSLVMNCPTMYYTITGP